MVGALDGSGSLSRKGEAELFARECSIGFSDFGVDQYDDLAVAAADDHSDGMADLGGGQPFIK